jgi:tetratricopeptide (TPR) repeat protein
MSEPQKLWINYLHAYLFETPVEEIKYLKLINEIDDQLPINRYDLGYAYYCLGQYEKSIQELEIAQAIYNKWDSKPVWAYNYWVLGRAYHETGMYKKEKELYKKAEKDFPDDLSIIPLQATLSLTEGDDKAAESYIEKYKSLCKENSWSEIDIITALAEIYSGAGMLEKAEQFYRQALSPEPENPDRLNNIAYFLIDKDRNNNEGLELVDKALKLSPDNYSYLHTKGWGLYKHGKSQEALEILQKSWDLRMKDAVYDHEAYLHLEEAKKAVANQKKN